MKLIKIAIIVIAVFSTAQQHASQGFAQEHNATVKTGGIARSKRDALTKLYTMDVTYGGEHYILKSNQAPNNSTLFQNLANGLFTLEITFNNDWYPYIALVQVKYHKGASFEYLYTRQHLDNDTSIGMKVGDSIKIPLTRGIGGATLNTLTLKLSAQ